MTGRVIGVPNYTGRQSDSVYAKLQWFIDHYDVLKLVKDNSFLHADSYDTIPDLAGIYKLADTGQVWERLVGGTLVRRQALEITPESLALMQSVVTNVDTQWNTVYKPAINADRTAFAQQQALNNAQAAAAANKTPAASTAAIPATLGLYYITGQAEAGQVWERLAVAENGSTLKRRPDLEAVNLFGLHYIDAWARGVRTTNTAAQNLAAMQATLDDAPDGSIIVIRAGVYSMGGTLYLSNKNDITIEASGAVFSYSGSRIGLLIHGGTFDRTLSGAAWSNQLLEKPYEGASYATNCVVRGLTTKSASSNRIGTGIFLYFTRQSGVERVTIQDSDGGAIEMRQSVQPFARRFVAKRVSNYGVFMYQSHGAVLEDFYMRDVGRAWEIKQRHKDYPTLGHRIRRGRVENATGFPPPLALQNGTNLTPHPAWVTSAVSYNDMMRKSDAEASPTVKANRNFPGHEISRDVEIEQVTLEVTPDAAPELGAPTVQIGAYADRWTIRRLICIGNGRASQMAALSSGDGGDHQFGGAFGGENVFEDCRWDGYNNPATAAPIVSYGTGLTLRRCSFNGTVRLMVAQAAVQYVPGGTVDKVVIEDCTADVTLVLGAAGEQGLRIRAETQSYVSRRNKFRFTPQNDTVTPANGISNPYYISAQAVDMDGDEYTLTLNPAADKHTTTFGYLTSPAGLAKNISTAFAAPTTVRGMAITVGGAALIIDGGTHNITNTPTGEKSGLWLSGDVMMRKMPVLAGAALLTDNTKRNITTPPNRVMYGAAPPVAGTHNPGDVMVNTAADAGKPQQWRCVAGGTPGTWVAEGQIGYRASTAAPTVNAYFVGEALLDTTNKKWYKAVSTGSGAADWVALN